MMATKQQVEDYIARRVPVILVETTERTGEAEVAVCVADNPEFWLNVFPTRIGAVAWCRERGLSEAIR